MKRLQALRLITADPETILFVLLAMAIAAAPIVTGLAYLFFHPQLAHVPLPRWAGYAASPAGAHALFLPIAMVIALPCVFIGTLLNVAMINCVAARLQGGEPTIGDGLAAIRRSLGASLQLAALHFSLLSVLAAVAQWLGLDKKDGEHGIQLIVASLASQSVNTASAFVLSVMVIDRVGFMEAARRAYALKRLLPRMMMFELAAAILMPLPLVWMLLVFFFQIEGGFIGVPLPIYLAVMAGPPFLMAFLFVVVSAILNIAFICAVYLAASRTDAASRARISEYFPDALEPDAASQA